MPNIQLDMFEVQLGAGILIQLEDDNQQPVTILADAGVSAAGYSSNHVLKKLPNCFKSFSTNAVPPYRIDLMVGTHYDADHLRGLVDVVDNPDIEITEAWLPPIANDVRSDPDTPASSSDFLVNQFASSSGEQIYRNYIEFHKQRCVDALYIEEEIVEVMDSREWLRNNELKNYNYNEDLRELRFQIDDLDNVEKYFQKHSDSAEARLPYKYRGGHADQEIDGEGDEDGGLQKHYVKEYLFKVVNKTTSSSIDNEINSRSGAMQMLTRAALVRKASASNAINATSLNKLVIALKKKNITIRALSINQGQPAYYLWGAVKHKLFGKVLSPIKKGRKNPLITLLGPSRTLIHKHRDRLPIGTYSALISFIPIKYITPSNQLSYVFKIESSGQKILITGDAGCVDFKKSRGRKYFPGLTAELGELHVVQVAHHGGNNAHFYRVLLKSGYGTNAQVPSFLLLSHATHDKKRPSKGFEQFVDHLTNNAVPFKILFTSEPIATKVNKYANRISPVAGTHKVKGDVRLTYDGSVWIIEKHAVRV